MTDIWVFKTAPAVISGARDDGNLPFHFEPPHSGGHLRIVQSTGKPADYDPSKDPLTSPSSDAERPEGGPGTAAARTSSARRSTSRRRSITASCSTVSACWCWTTARRAEAGRRGRAARQLARLDQSQCGSLMAFVMMGAKFDVERRTSSSFRKKSTSGFPAANATTPRNGHDQDPSRCAESSPSTKKENRSRSQTAPRRTCAPTRRGRDSRRPASGSRTPRRYGSGNTGNHPCRTRSSRRRADRSAGS